MPMPFDAIAVLDGLAQPLVVLNRAGAILYANGEFRRASGNPAATVEGVLLGAAWPSVARVLEHASYLHAVSAGEKVVFDYASRPALLRCEIVVQPIDSSSTSLLFREVRDQPTVAPPQPAEVIEIPGHPHAGLHSQMLADMGACLRADLNAADTFYQVANILGRLHDVSRSTFGTVDNQSKTVTIHRDFCRDAPSMAGVYPMSETEITSQELSRGQVVVITDVRTDYRTRDTPELRYKRGYLACVAIPLMRRGEWAASLMVQSPVPRVWSSEEIELIRTAAERTWLAVENMRLLQEARQANAAKDQFLAMLSHELRTPLTPVVMMLNALQGSDSISAEEKEDLAMIRRNIDLETRLIDDLLDITRIANQKLALSLRPARVHELIEHVCQICKPDAESGRIQLLCKLGASCDSVEADSARLEQVFWNLIKNAIKFTPAGGTVQVATRDGDGELLLAVQDSGAGIAPDVLPRIFNAFEQGEKTVTRTFGGLGLGLAISKAIVDLHGGKISAHSDGVNRGAEFRVALPIKMPALADGVDLPHDSRARTDRRSRGVRVLVVDDHADTMRIMQRILKGWGMHATGASGIEDAMQALSRGKFDLLISDIGLPDGSGCELIQRVRKHQQIPAIALSGFGMETDIQRSLDAGFAAHLTKPVSLEQLQSAIAALLPQEQEVGIDGINCR